MFSEYFCSYSVTFESNLIIEKSSEIEQYFQIINQNVTFKAKQQEKKKRH